MSIDDNILDANNINAIKIAVDIQENQKLSVNINIDGFSYESRKMMLADILRIIAYDIDRSIT